ncbi:hypothetical protein Lal_00033836 [Lupinus albus]|nr:hypothetical protein Lal_00033836 [Lupinus albus]
MVNIPSYRCKPQDIFTTKDEPKSRALIQNDLDSAPRDELPTHLTLHPFQYKGLVNQIIDITRKERDSNPRYKNSYNGLAIRRFSPLSLLSPTKKKRITKYGNNPEKWGRLSNSRLSETFSPKREGQSYAQDFIWESRLSEKCLAWTRERGLTLKGSHLSENPSLQRER